MSLVRGLDVLMVIAFAVMGACLGLLATFGAEEDRRDPGVRRFARDLEA